MSRVERDTRTRFILLFAEFASFLLFSLARDADRVSAGAPEPIQTVRNPVVEVEEEVAPAVSFSLEFGNIPVLPVPDVDQVGFVTINGVQCIIYKGEGGALSIHDVVQGNQIGSKESGVNDMSILPGRDGRLDQLIVANTFGFGAEAKSEIAEVVGSLGPNGPLLFGEHIGGLDPAISPKASWLMDGSRPVLTILFSTLNSEGLPSGSFVAFKNSGDQNTLAEQNAPSGFEVFRLEQLPNVAENQRIIVDIPSVEGLQQKLVLSITYNEATQTYSIQSNVLTFNNVDGNWTVDVGAANVFVTDNLGSAEFVSEHISDAQGNYLALAQVTDGRFLVVESTTPDSQGQVENHAYPVLDTGENLAVAEGMFNIAGGRIIGAFRDTNGDRHFFNLQKHNSEAYSLAPVEVTGDPEQLFFLFEYDIAAFVRYKDTLSTFGFVGNIFSREALDLYQSTSAGTIEFKTKSSLPVIVVTQPS